MIDYKLTNMNIQISPSYTMRLIEKIEKTIWNNYSSPINVKYYIEKWRDEEYIRLSGFENISIILDENKHIDLLATLHSASGMTLLQIAIDLGIETLNFIPSIPIFRNELKTSYQTANSTFERAFELIEEHPNNAIGLANSALESIIKEILKDERFEEKFNPKQTLYKLTENVLEIFHLYPNTEIPIEIRDIGSSLLKLSQQIEKLRSEKTEFHGKTKDDYIVNEPLYAYFILNSVATVGLFLNSYYQLKFQKTDDDNINLPF